MGRSLRHIKPKWRQKTYGGSEVCSEDLPYQLVGPGSAVAAFRFPECRVGSQ